MATGRGMKENRHRRGRGGPGRAKPPPSMAHVAPAATNHEEILKELALNELVQDTYERVYRSLNAGDESPPPPPPPPPPQKFADKPPFQQELPVPVDKSRFLRPSALKAELTRQQRKPQALVGNWTLEEVWRERGIPFAEAAIEFPPLESRGANPDPNLSPEELRAFGLAPRSYDYLFENLDGADSVVGSSSGDHLLGQNGRQALPRIPLQISQSWPSLEEVMKGVEGLNFSYFTEFPGDYLVVNRQGEAPRKKNRKMAGGRQVRGRGSKYGR